MSEQWKPIIIEKQGVLYDYTGLYEISSLGRVKSLRNAKCLKTHKNKHGYLRVGLNKDGCQQTFLVHRLVASAFLENPNDFPDINHKDENKENNCIDNLEWCSRKYNTQYSNNRKVLCIETGRIFNNMAEAKEWCGVNIGRCCKGERKTAGGYHWKYVDEEE
jgi:hypothetical protein